MIAMLLLCFDLVQGNWTFVLTCLIVIMMMAYNKFGCCFWFYNGKMEKYNYLKKYLNILSLEFYLITLLDILLIVTF